VRLARQLPSLPHTNKAFERGELSSQHASMVARSVEMVVRGGGNPGEAEVRLLQEAQYRNPRDLFRWGLSLVHEMAPKEMEAEEQRREDRRYPDSVRPPRGTGGMARLGIPAVGQGAAADRRRRRDHADPGGRQGGPAAGGSQVPDGDHEDEKGAGGARPALRVAPGVRSAP